MSDALFSQLLATTTGLLLVTAVLQVWRYSLSASIRVLAVQGAALGALVVVLGLHHGDPEVLVVAVLVLAMKAVAIPWALSRTADGHRGRAGTGPADQPHRRPARGDGAHGPGLRRGLCRSWRSWRGRPPARCRSGSRWS